MNEPHVVVDLIHREWGSASVFEPGVLPDLPRTLGQDDTLGFEDLLGPFDPVAAMIRRAIVGVHAIRCIVSGHDRRIASIVEADPMIQGDADVPQAPLVPPFTEETAIRKARAAEDAWNSRDPERVSLAYTEDSHWRNRAEFVQGREEIRQFLSRKWKKELDYRLIKELWAFGTDRIAVRFQYEWHNVAGQWHRAYGNELWEFDENGLMRRREASINDVSIAEEDRRFHWPAPGPRPENHPGLIDSPA